MLEVGNWADQKMSVHDKNPIPQVVSSGISSKSEAPLHPSAPNDATGR
jgi:hypothetical protein